MHPFEHVSGTNPTAAGFAGILNEDVVFHGPIFIHPVTGRGFVAELLETVHGIFGRPSYWLRLSEGVVRGFGEEVMARLGLSEADDTPSPDRSGL
jgi:hypothetical protein